MNIDDQLKKICRGTNEVIPLQELKDKLASGRPLRIKLGVDPTAPDLHLGHTVLINKLRTFQELGHHIVFIIGDFTARIGDPSGRSDTRPMMTEADILNNSQTYQDQVFKILDRSKTEVVFNSTWLSPLGIEGLLKLASKYTVAQMLVRDDFEKRYKNDTPISIVEFLYPLLQGYDSVAVKADLEMGGNDQKFNLLVGRELQKDFGQPPQVILTMPLLEGTDGVRKMSKSYGNYIALNDSPKDMFGKIMSISDELMFKYYELLTQHAAADIKALHPREAKANLGEEITAQYHGKDAAATARAEFDSVFSLRNNPADMKVFCCTKTMKLVDILVAAELVASKNEARRLLQQGAVKVNDAKVMEDIEMPFPVTVETVIQAGKRKFVKIKSE
jgi:tyrosyl-tRNA synthetase